MKKRTVFWYRASALLLSFCLCAGIFTGCAAAGGDLPAEESIPAAPQSDAPQSDAELAQNMSLPGPIVPDAVLPVTAAELTLVYAVCPGAQEDYLAPYAAGSLLTDILKPQGWLRLQISEAAELSGSVLLGAKNAQGAQFYWCGGEQVHLRGNYDPTLQTWAITPAEANALRALYEKIAAEDDFGAQQRVFHALIAERGDFGEPLSAMPVTTAQSEALLALLQSTPWQPLEDYVISSSLREDGCTLYAQGGYALDISIGGAAGVIQLGETLRDGETAYYALDLSLMPRLFGLLRTVRYAPAGDLRWVGRSAQGTEATSFWEGEVWFRRALNTAQQARLYQILQPESWIAAENTLTPGEWYGEGTVFADAEGDRLVLQGDMALYVPAEGWREPVAWQLPQGTAAAVAAFFATLAADPAAPLFEVGLEDFTVIGLDTLGPGSFDTRFELTGEWQQRFLDALHPESWQRYEAYVEAGWTVSFLTAAAPDGTQLRIYPQGGVAFLEKDGVTGNFRLPPQDADAALALLRALEVQRTKNAPSLPYDLTPVRVGSYGGRNLNGTACAHAAGGELFNWRDNGCGWFVAQDGAVTLTWRSGARRGASPLRLEEYDPVDTAGLGVFVSETVSALAAPAGENIALYITPDCGISWQSAALPAADTAKIFLGFTDAQHGWLVAEASPAAGSAAHRLFFTSDGGAVWREQPLAAPAAVCGQLSGAGFVDENTGFLCERYGSGLTVYATFDGGASWRTLPLEGDARTEAWSPVKDSSGAILLPLGQRDEEGNWRLYFAVSYGGESWDYVTRP